MAYRLARLPATARLAVAAFVLLLIGLHAAGQATLWVTVGEGALPGPDAVLAKYHGHPDRSRLHEVLDLDRSADDPLAMYFYLDAASSPDDLDLVKARRKTILDWVEAGAPEEGWPPVRTVLHDQAMCLNCHGFGGELYDRAPLETLEQVRALAAPGRGVVLGQLLVSAHSHVFGFAVLALLLGLALAFTGARPFLRVALVAAAFGGAALDVGSWFLTRAWGSPWEWAVILGGALFGVSTVGMALLVLDEVAFRGRFARAVGVGEGEPPR